MEKYQEKKSKGRHTNPNLLIITPLWLLNLSSSINYIHTHTHTHTHIHTHTHTPDDWGSYKLPETFSSVVNIQTYNAVLRCQSPRGLRSRSATARLMRLWARIPPRAWMFVCCGCSVLSGRGLCDEPITRPEESYRLWCVVVWSRNRRRAACGRSPAEIVGSNPTGGMDICLLWVSCVVR